MKQASAIPQPKTYGPLKIFRIWKKSSFLNPYGG